MNVVQTAFIDGQRLQSLVPWPVVTAMYPDVDLQTQPIGQTGDGKLVLAWRKPVERDWVDGEFVGDHECPEEGHMHGRPV